MPVYKFNSKNFFSPDNDRKRPLATIALCRTTPRKCPISCLYIANETGRMFYSIMQFSTNLWRKKVMWWTIVTFKTNVITRQKNNQYLRCSNHNNRERDPAQNLLKLHTLAYFSFWHNLVVLGTIYLCQYIQTQLLRLLHLRY